MVVLAKFALVMLLSQTPGTAPVGPRESAELHVKRGNEALRSGDPERAISEYGDAHRLFPSPKILGNLGQAFERAHQPGQALWCFEQFLQAHQDADTSVDPELSRGLAIARRRVEALRGQVTPEKPTEVTDPAAVAFPPALERVPLTAAPLPRPPVAPALVAPAVAEVKPTPPNHTKKWILIGTAAVAATVATILVVRALRDGGCRAELDVCLPPP